MLRAIRDDAVLPSIRLASTLAFRRSWVANVVEFLDTFHDRVVLVVATEVLVLSFEILAARLANRRARIRAIRPVLTEVFARVLATAHETRGRHHHDDCKRLRRHAQGRRTGSPRVRAMTASRFSTGTGPP